MEIGTVDSIRIAMSKTLKAKIRCICAGIIKFLEETGKDITNIITDKRSIEIRQPLGGFICFGERSIFFLDSNLRKILQISYDVLRSIEKDQKSNSVLHIKTHNIKKNGSVISKISIISKNRDYLLQNFELYYACYFEVFHNTMSKKFLSKSSFEENPQDKKKEEKKVEKLKEEILKNYSFILRGSKIIKNQSSPGYHINYISEKKRGEDEENKYFSNECDLIVEISDEIQLNTFEKNQNENDIAYYAYSSVLSYLRNSLKSGKFWILQNEMYIKRFNLNQDMSAWEGWKIEVRTCEPEYLNLIFIFLRRRYIPPFFDTYQDFTIILKENSSKEQYSINPISYNVAYLVADSLSSSISSTTQDFEIFLKAKVDALLADEGALTFYQSNGIIGKEIYKFGYEFLFAVIEFFETTNVQEQIQPLKNVIIGKTKKYGITCNKWKFEKRTWEFAKKIENMISNEFKKESKDETEGEIPVSKYFPNGKRKKVTGKELRWTKKLMRFIGFVLNGGLTEGKMDYDYFLKKILDSCQNKNNDLNDLCFYTIDIRELTPSQKDKIFQSKGFIDSLDSNSKITLNINPLSYCVASNFLMKYLEGSGSKFLATLLTTNCSNKLLKAIYENFKYGDSPNVNPEKGKIKFLIAPLREIFEDQRNNPITLLLACKSLCFLAKEEKNNRVKLCEEGNTLKAIECYIDEFDYDITLTLCSLDLLGYIMTEMKDEVKDILYNTRGTGLMDKMLKFLKKPVIPGVYYSQRVMIKVLSILLTMTTNLKAELRESFNNGSYQYFYQLIVDLLKKDTREKIIDPSEEESSILDFKIFYLIIVVTSKNNYAQDYLFNELNFKEVIESLSEKYLNHMKVLIGLKDKVSDTELNYVGKKIYKFLEMVYYLIINNDERKVEIYQRSPNFNSLKKFCDEKMGILLKKEEPKTDVLNMLSKVFYKLQEEEI